MLAESLEHLLDVPADLLGNGVFVGMPDICKYDFTEACKCIAFDRPTAAAFHLMRCVEGHLRAYYCAIVRRGRVDKLMWFDVVAHLKKRRDAPPKALLDNLDDPTAKKSIDLLPSEQKRAVNAFLKAKALPDKISNDLVQGMQTALGGLIPIVVRPPELLAALSDGDAPCTPDQLEARFKAFVEKVTRGKEQVRVRLIVKRTDNPGGQE